MAVLKIKCPRTGQICRRGAERGAARGRSTAIEIDSIL
jgi:hypothetical protein